MLTVHQNRNPKVLYAPKQKQEMCQMANSEVKVDFPLEQHLRFEECPIEKAVIRIAARLGEWG